MHILLTWSDATGETTLNVGSLGDAEARVKRGAGIDVLDFLQDAIGILQGEYNSRLAAFNERPLASQPKHI